MRFYVHRWSFQAFCDERISLKAENFPINCRKLSISFNTKNLIQSKTNGLLRLVKRTFQNHIQNEKNCFGNCFDGKKQLIFVFSIMQNKKSVTYKIIINYQLLSTQLVHVTKKNCLNESGERERKRKRIGKRKRDN